MSIPTTPASIRSRIASYRRAMRRERDTIGMISDGRGKRMLLFYLYFLLGDEAETRIYIDWYQSEFPDDGGELTQYLCWALFLRRIGRLDEARYRLVKAIDDNLPEVARLVGDCQAPYGIWSEEIMALYQVDPEVVDAMSPEERQWLADTWHAEPVAAMRQRYVEIGRALTTREISRDQRVQLLDERRALIAAFRPTESPPLSGSGSDPNWLMRDSAASRDRRTGRNVIRTDPGLWYRE